MYVIVKNAAGCLIMLWGRLFVPDVKKIRKPRALVSDIGKATIRIKSSMQDCYVAATEFGVGDSVKEKQVMLRRQL